jgi:hypothetical protein
VPGSESGKCCCSASVDEPVIGSCCQPTDIGATSSAASCRPSWIGGMVPTLIGEVPQLRPALRLSDHLGACRMRLGIGRMRYRVPPGLYAMGSPTAESPVLVTANYKLTVDHLRSKLDGTNAWILVLDTKGVNVWCAAGKGTFGTDEIVRQVAATSLGEVVSHRQLVVPQLGAPGVAAHQVKNRCGFRVIYGPVRAPDIPAFLAAGMQATPAMRRVDFPLGHRLAVVPIEVTRYAKYFLPAAAVLFFLAGLGTDGYSWSRAAGTGTLSAVLLLFTWLASAVLAPALLPWLPGRPLALKGLWLGLALLGVLTVGTWGLLGKFDSWLGMVSWALLIPAVSSFIAMIYTGSTTYTSLSGVRYEMRRAVPAQVVAAVAGLAAWIAGRFV